MNYFVGQDSIGSITAPSECMVQGSNPIGGAIFFSHPNWPCDPHSLLYNGYWVSFLGVEWLGRGVDHPPHLTSVIKNE